MTCEVCGKDSFGTGYYDIDERWRDICEADFLAPLPEVKP